jgi:hypothetical protein
MDYTISDINWSSRYPAIIFERDREAAGDQILNVEGLKRH